MSDPTDREHAGAPGGAARTLAAAFGVLLVLAAGALGPACLLDGSPIEGAGTAGRGEGPTTSGGGAVSAGGGAVSAGGDGGAVSVGGAGGTTTGGSGGQGGASTTSTTSTTTSTTSTTSTSTGGGQCMSGCYDCGTSSLDFGGSCDTEAGLCLASPTCQSYLGCVNGCGQDWCSPGFKACQESCLVTFKNTASQNLSCCVRSACTAECGIAPCP
jgi:hypothetical protein